MGYDAIHDMRRTYDHGELHESAVGDEPLSLFREWFDDAKARAPGEWFEANAMTLATADGAGDVSARIVLLKGFGDPALGDGGFVFYTNHHSQKGRQLAANGRASLVFYWPHVDRQVRVAGGVLRLPAQQSEAYFRSRPRESQLGAAASRQSEVIADRETLAAEFERQKSDAGHGPIPMPTNWGGYAVSPERVEFWQGRPGRLHDRLRFVRDGDAWRLERLCP
ncbi:MAG: pyridoxamine 5'-phosphate oxidase [Planctomycetota bacterium]